MREAMQPRYCRYLHSLTGCRKEMTSRTVQQYIMQGRAQWGGFFSGSLEIGIQAIFQRCHENAASSFENKTLHRQLSTKNRLVPSATSRAKLFLGCIET
jgi:hypothetical protein